VSHQAVRCGFHFYESKWFYGDKNKIVDDRLKAHPKGANQHLQQGVIAAQHGITMLSQQCLVLNALVCAYPSL